MCFWDIVLHRDKGEDSFAVGCLYCFSQRVTRGDTLDPRVFTTKQMAESAGGMNASIMNGDDSPRRPVVDVVFMYSV